MAPKQTFVKWGKNARICIFVQQKTNKYASQNLSFQLFYEHSRALSDGAQVKKGNYWTGSEVGIDDMRACLNF